jgi:putative transposase
VPVVVPVARLRNGEIALWQRRYWEHTIRDEKDYGRHLDYIHFNPVKHGLVDRVLDWPYSSSHLYVRQGLLPQDWADDFKQDLGGYGEREPPRREGCDITLLHGAARLM